jgi:hypothetical protein
MQLKEIAADGTTSEMLREIGTPQIVSETADTDGALRCD